MDKKKILQHLDHTLLKQDATWEQIKTLCDEGMQYHVASVCIPPCYVKEARDYVADRLKICTVIGFPNGNTTTQAKEAEAKEVLEAGADEIDMVINVGMVKEGDYGAVQQEIETLRKISQGPLNRERREAARGKAVPRHLRAQMQAQVHRESRGARAAEALLLARTPHRGRRLLPTAPYLEAANRGFASAANRMDATNNQGFVGV